LVIIKKDGRREIFDREKVLNGILKAVEKRPISVEILESITDLIEKEIRDEGYEEVSSSRVGEKVMEKLKELDQVAYVRFASVYREFRDIDQFMEILTTLKTGEKQ
jgi:transcriptional repressor NrdR